MAVAAWRAGLRKVAEGENCQIARRLQSYEVESAGLTAHAGQSAARNAVAVAAGWGEDLKEHRSRRATPALLQGAGLVITMTSEQAATVRMQYHVRADQVRHLGTCAPLPDPQIARLGPLLGWPAGHPLEMPEGLLDILDPFGGSLEAYQACGANIVRCVTGLMHELYLREECL